MTDETKALSLVEQRSRLERRANAIRSRLLRTIDALDDRRDQVVELGYHARRLAVPILGAVVGVGIVVYGATRVTVAIVKRRRERHLGYRLAEALSPVLAPPRRLLWRETLRAGGLAAASALASELVRRSARLFDGPARHLPGLPARRGARK